MRWPEVASVITIAHLPSECFCLKQGEVQKPIYHVPHFANKTGTLAVYSPKGSWRNPQKRNWKKVEAWDYTKA